MFVKNPHAAVIAYIAHHLGIHPRGDSEEVFSNCLDKATEAESWSFAPVAILFWIAHVAERNLMGDDLPAKADENAFNGRLLTALMSAARKEGRLLAYQLGYDEHYPPELGVLETERQVIEPNVGADFCILVYFKKQDGNAIVCAALVQGKMEGEGLTDAYTTNIFRDSSFGVNHQIRALTSPEKDGYHAVYLRSRATRPIVVATAQDFCRLAVKRENADVIFPLSSLTEIRWVGNLIKFNTCRQFGRRTNLTLSAKNPSGSLKLDARSQI
ncbi:hypothetical protein [Neorhizobium huautlense]|uniref:hypothetical protein n=1 Tax=Neorhizobium huautlense TaxID=67774 RepID=UPI00130093E3|nr:hypothetical protein [Neorhizobium huautlense]